MGKSVREVLLTQRGLAFVACEGGAPASAETVRAVELELAALGYVPSAQLHARLAECSTETLTHFHDWACETLREHLGASEAHEPLFRRFPDGVPDDTLVLWWEKVLVHFLQAKDQPCLFCGRTGTTHVLNPCLHVVCDYCFDGANYSACPVCEHHVDRSSPFFLPVPERGVPEEDVKFKLLHLGGAPDEEARKLFVSLCARKQAVSYADRDVLTAVVHEYPTQVLSWVPAEIPVRENTALVFGTLFREGNPAEVLPHARRHLKTATDVLRLLVVFSGADGSLQGETRLKYVDRLETPQRFWGFIAKLLGTPEPELYRRGHYVSMKVNRFKVAKLPRSLRRAMLELLAGFNSTTMTEDMLRHRSYWVWLGEFLHPGEYAERYPQVAAAFAIVRKKMPDGSPAPEFRSWYGRMEQAIRGQHVEQLLAILAERPGEFARRVDLVLRLAQDDAARLERVVAAFVDKVPTMATPVLLLLYRHLQSRTQTAPVRVYWPKGKVALGASEPDRRRTLSPSAVEPFVRAATAELLRRFAAKPGFLDGVVDEALRTIPVPFNERTASLAAVSLPRGSAVPVPIEKTVRLFLHWCQPEQGGRITDLDLSVAVYDAQWQYLGVCSYYQLKLEDKLERLIAQSSGDLRSAPWPDGASEFVDLNVKAAATAGARYAVMVVTNYAGMPFSLLERVYAGLMIRADLGGQHFDPRTVELKFKIDGENGVFMPVVIDLEAGLLHWLDVQAEGMLEMNNVEKSRSAIAKICPALIQYFAGGLRPTMYDLGLLHAAARCRRVTLRGSEGARVFERRADEDAVAFHHRLLQGAGDGDAAQSAECGPAPILAVLCRGDAAPPQGSECYALFRDRAETTIAASDLLS